MTRPHTLMQIRIKSSKTTLPCKGIIFDKDGTLIDVFSMLSALGKERYKQLSCRVDEHALSFLGRCTGFDIRTQKVAPYGPLASAARRDEVAVAACALWLAGIPWFKAIAVAKESYDEADKTLDVTKDVCLLPGVKQTLASLHAKGFYLFVVTSDGHDRTEKMLSHLGIAGYFKLIVAADDVKSPKPDPEAVEICAKSINSSPKDLIVVGDTPQDAIMGRKAGAKTVGVLTGVAPRADLEEYCDFVISGVKDIKPV